MEGVIEKYEGWIFHLLVHSTDNQNSQHWARQRLPHMGVSCPNTCAIFWCFPQVINSELDQKWISHTLTRYGMLADFLNHSHGLFIDHKAECIIFNKAAVYSQIWNWDVLFWVSIFKVLLCRAHVLLTTMCSKAWDKQEVYPWLSITYLSLAMDSNSICRIFSESVA